jgi:hypothetical protein
MNGSSLEVTKGLLGKLESVDPRSVWSHEALDFTPWLLENPEILAETLGIDIELTENEHPVGGYSLDLLGVDRTHECTLIIENQLTTTDHGHLGQLLTYAAGTDAVTVIWIATAFREEHRQAMSYLNEVAGENARFFAVEVSAVRIGDSPAAPLFKLVAQPNDWHAAVSQKAKDAQSGGGKKLVYREFWDKFLAQLHSEIPNWSKTRKAQAQSWMNIYWPSAGAHFTVAFSKNQKMKAELYIDSGDAEENLELFELLQSQREEIESVFGQRLDWQDLEGKQACRICVWADGDVLEEAQHPMYISWMVEQLKRFRDAFPSARFKF